MKVRDEGDKGDSNSNKDDIFASLQKIREQRPLILNITNDVTMDFIANGLLSLGASPIMSQAWQEIEDLMQITQTVVINIGTLHEDFLALCEHVGKAANQFNKPIILDPVGAGASRYRTDAAMKILNNYHIAIIRGNASEITALGGTHAGKTKGVESTLASKQALASAQYLSQHYNTAVVISGETDIVLDEKSAREKYAQFTGGSPLMPMVIGSGCLLSSVVAAFHAVCADRFTAACLATHFYSQCGELAAEHAKGPGEFRTKFIDALGNRSYRT